jgi:hypothetical protein
MATLGPILLATAFSTAFAADSPSVGAWQLDPGQSGQAALYLFKPEAHASAHLGSGQVAARHSSLE